MSGITFIELSYHNPSAVSTLQAEGSELILTSGGTGDKRVASHVSITPVETVSRDPCYALELESVLVDPDDLRVASSVRLSHLAMSHRTASRFAAVVVGK
jgi:hypothetical protein